MLQENILKEASHLSKNSQRLFTVSRRMLHSKRRILRSPMPNEHPEYMNKKYETDKISKITVRKP